MGCFHIKTKRHRYLLHIWSYHGAYAYMALRREYNDQKQSFAGVLQNSYSQKFSKFGMRTPMLESLFNKLLHRCFPETILKSFANSIGKFLCCSLFLKNSYAGVSLWNLLNWTPFLQNTSGGCFWMVSIPCKIRSNTYKYFATKVW